ncbi:UDP-N-acetylglucosamine 2-epimerase [Azospirillaceae bacterium]
MSRKILCTVGTRPEVIKMAPVIAALRRRPWAEVRVLATAQHREMLDRSMAAFGLDHEIDLNLMRPGQSLAQLTSRLFEALEPTLLQEKPDLVLAQGDTTTVMAMAMTCFYLGIPFGHVEAGLRTGSLNNPFPEEFNRVVAGRVARLHFAPTERQQQFLLAEGVDPETIFVTGNTVIDALLETAGRKPNLGFTFPEDQRLLLLTAHRRENFGAPLREIFLAVRDLVERHPDLCVLYPVHPNPNVQDPARALLGGVDRIHLCEPLDYLPFVAAMQRAYIILTDSGGVQEEAPALAKPVLVLRRETERPEAVEAGVVDLVGPDRGSILAKTSLLLNDPAAYRAMARGVSPYGDGRAAERISGIIESFFAASPS